MKRQTLFISVVFVLQTAYCILPTLSCAQKIACGGSNHSLAICIDSMVMAWGSNGSGQLGDGTNSASWIPVSVSMHSGVISVAGGSAHSVALKNDGTVWAWGRNQYGQLGNGTNANSNVPVQTISLTNVIAIAAGGDHSLALKNDGTVWAWGSNYLGELGNGTNTNSNVPVQINSLTDIVAIAGGYFHSIALKNDSSVWAWGSNYFGTLGNGTNTDSNIPVQINSLMGITAITAGLTNSMALKNDGAVWAWGYNALGQLGNGTSGYGTDSNIPVQVSSLTGITAIAAGSHHSLALKNDSTAWAWGEGLNGELGNGTFGYLSNLPGKVDSITGITSIVAGERYSLALKNDGTVWAWGQNWYGQLGDGTNTTSNVPLQVIGLCQVLNSVNEITEPLSISVFPNPTSGNSFVNYTLSSPAPVSIALYDVLGNKLQQLVNGDQQEGDHNAAFDARKLSNGIYILQIRAGDQMAEQKVVVMN